MPPVAEGGWPSHPVITNMQCTPQYAVGWFTLSLINAGLAQGKGRSGLGWWFGSLFLGPICTLLIVLLDPIRATADAAH